ncbi:MAG TPA: hypothetical protein VEU62_23155 [Bryobacterales bacterium]|nr:hypothetical protein [Bryobacterales bacterium]
MKSKRIRRRLSRRAEQIIAALLEHPTQEKAAAAAGISTVTLWRWLRKPKFQKALLQARREAYSQAVARLQQGSAAAAATLLRVMCDGAAPASTRVRAADKVLGHAAKAMENEDLAVRVAALEEAAPTT